MLPSYSNIIPKNDVIKFSRKIESLIKPYKFRENRNNYSKKNSSIFYEKFSQIKMLNKYQKWKTI